MHKPNTTCNSTTKESPCAPGQWFVWFGAIAHGCKTHVRALLYLMGRWLLDFSGLLPSAQIGSHGTLHIWWARLPYPGGNAHSHGRCRLENFGPTDKIWAEPAKIVHNNHAYPESLSHYVQPSIIQAKSCTARGCLPQEPITVRFSVNTVSTYGPRWLLARLIPFVACTFPPALLRRTASQSTPSLWTRYDCFH